MGKNIYFVLTQLLLITAFIIGNGIFLTSRLQPKIEQSEKMRECIRAGGQFQIRDWSWKNDSSDYRATCEIPEHQLWSISLEK